MKQLLTVGTISLLLGCSKTNITPTTGTDVYVAGYTFNSARIQVAKFWKNGVATNLTDGKTNSGTSGIGLSGYSVVISGWDEGNNTPITDVGKIWVNSTEMAIQPNCLNTVAIAADSANVCILGVSTSGWSYWRNGSITSITDTVNFQATGIAISKGDVFVSGYTGLLTDHQAQYWRNGVLVFTSPSKSVANAIAVNKGDVYLAGYRTTENTQTNTALYWKNGTAIPLTDGTTNAKVNAIIISGNDVYVAGAENNTAKYWKNGTAVILTDGTLQAEAKSIAVKGDDVYLAGYEGSNPRLWKNGIAQTLADGSLDGAAISVAVK